MSDETANQWPINPNFPHSFTFPEHGTDHWVAISIWNHTRGSNAALKPAERLSANEQSAWVLVWEQIRYSNARAAAERFSHFTSSELENHTLSDAGKWVETLLDPQRFWDDINGWALSCVEKEADELDPVNAGSLPTAEEQCRRFHAYQQARFRYHEHLLETLCPRSLGKDQEKNPETGSQARACLVGWLSGQRGCAKHRFVTQFTRRKARAERKKERFFFDKERNSPSARIQRADANELAWLILTWPIWNFHNWRWVEICYAIHLKFRMKDLTGKPLDFQEENRRKLWEDLSSRTDENGLIPGELLFALAQSHIVETDDEKFELRLKRRKSDDRSIEQLGRRHVGLPISSHPKGRPPQSETFTEPPLWDFSFRIFA